MKIALIYPPTCDPTGPYLSVPMLSAYLRTHGIEVLPIDANVEAYDRLLRRAALREMAGRVTDRLKRLERKASLGHADQLLYARLWEVLPDLARVPEAVEDAVAVLRDPSGARFFDPGQYEQAIQTVQAALRLISAAFSPLTMDFSVYRTPFSLLTPEQIKSDADPAKNPFHDYFAGELSELLSFKPPDVIGISLAFPGQIQPGYALAYTLRQKLPAAHLTVGGPAITQILVRLASEKIPQLLGPFHSAVLFEGEEMLLALVRMLAGGHTPPRVLCGNRSTNLDLLPPPDFTGMPLDKYLSPEPVLPYDPTRGCYWGKCAFCHYGLSPRGTAVYRQRSIDRIVAHLLEMEDRWGCRTVYFSQDAFAPKTARKLARKLRSAGTSLQWASDMRPEPDLTPDCCRDLKDGGALSTALGIESAAPRLLELIDKGISLQDMQKAVKNLAAAGIAVEAMCFSEFPTETYAEANATIAFIDEMRDHISLFIFGRFGLCHGSRVACSPEDYGIQEIWCLKGDELQTGLFYEERQPAKSEFEREKLDHAIDRLSAGWWLHDYPWAGALSTAHTLLWYARFGSDVFKRFADTPRRMAGPQTPAFRSKRFDIDRMTRVAGPREAEIWHTLIYHHKAVSPALYELHSRVYPPQLPRKNRTNPARPRRPARKPRRSE
ncbi:MAG: radical SAM protein [Desulfobacterales bacterium]|nr:MAG: radical SAM protein [Desulfobacterales bacterium]